MQATPADSQEKLKKVVDRIQSIPTLPDMLSKINRMMLNPRTSAKEVAQLISSDPSITSKVLRVVNSSFYGFPRRITTISHAIVILGFNAIKSIVLSSTIFDVFKKDGKSGFDRMEFWKHSIGCGAAARVLGQKAGSASLEEIFIAGLLHDVGRIVLDQFDAEQFAEVVKLVRARDCRMMDAEEEVFGVSHADVGAWLFEKWSLSPGLVETTRCHHNPALAHDHAKSAAIVHFADILVRAVRFGSGGDLKIPALSDAAWKLLGLDPAQFDDILRDTGQEIQKAVVFLDFIR